MKILENGKWGVVLSHQAQMIMKEHASGPIGGYLPVDEEGQEVSEDSGRVAGFATIIDDDVMQKLRDLYGPITSDGEFCRAVLRMHIGGAR